MRREWMVVLALVLWGCGGDGRDGSEDPDGDDVGQVKQAFNGEAIFTVTSYCNASRKDKIEDAFAIAYAQLHTNPEPLRLCLDDATFSAVRPSAEYIMDRLKEDMPTYAYCRSNPCGSSSALACAPVDVGIEKVTFDNAYLDGSTAADVASVLLHEVAHNKGWDHMDPGSSGLWLEYSMSVNEQVRNCSLFNQPNFIRRRYVHDEVELGATGGLGGDFFDLSCPDGEFMTGTYVASDNVVRQLFPRCAAWNSSSSHYMGGSAGSSSGATSFNQRSCSSSSVMTGIEGRAGSLIDRLAIRCTSKSTVAVGYLAWGTVAADGGSGGTSFYRQCPAGMAVKRLYGRAGAAIDRLRVVCQSVNEPERGPFEVSSLYGTASGHQDQERCWGFGAMYSLFGAADSEVRRLSGACEVGTGDWFPLPANGGGTDEGALFVDECDLGDELVGVLVRGGNRVKQIQGICAPAGGWWWYNQLEYLPARGQDSGAATVKLCDPGEYMVGLETWKSTTNGTMTIQGLRTICRDL